MILVYHSIGIAEGWSYYPMDDFVKDLDQIVELDFWSANMGAAAAYIRERNAFTLSLSGTSIDEDGTPLYHLMVADGLPNDIYDQPVSLLLRFDPRLRRHLVEIRPPAGEASRVSIQDGVALIDLVPNEREYVIRLD